MYIYIYIYIYRHIVYKQLYYDFAYWSTACHRPQQAMCNAISATISSEQ